MFDADEWLEIGKIVAPQGLRGEMRVYPSSDFPERFVAPGERWLLRPGRDRPESVQLVEGRFLSNKGLYVIQLDGITGRDQAEALRHARLMVPASDRPPLEEGEYHVRDLVGLLVYHQTTGAQLGTVCDVLTAGNDLLEVELLPTDSQVKESAEMRDSEAESSEMTPSKPTSSQEAIAQSTAVESLEFSRKSASSVRRTKAKRAAKNAAKRAAKQTKPTVKRVLIPFVEEIVPVVDLEHQRIEVRPPSGLIDEG